MTDRLSNVSSMYDPNIFELVWENNQILLRSLTSNITSKNSGLPCSEYFPSKGHIQHEGKTFTASGSKDLVSDKFGDLLDRYYDKNEINNCSPQAAGNPEILSELYEEDDDFNVDTPHYDRQLVDSQIVPVNEFKNFRQNYPIKLVEKIPQCIMNSDSEKPQSCLKQCEASVPLNRSKEKNSGIYEKRNWANFSIFLRSPSLIKSILPRVAEATSSMAGLARVNDDLERCMMQFEPTNNGSKGVSRSMRKEVNAMGSNMNAILPDSEPQIELLPDQQSEAVCHEDIRKSSNLPGNGKFAEQVVPSSSGGSRGASNCPAYTLKRYEDDTSENAMVEPEDKPKAAAAARRSKGAKGKRKSEVHSLSEKRRRKKFNKKMRALKELIPNCDKMDKASMLDEAIEYLRKLQLQLQMMSMGSGIYMPPNPMIQTAMQQLVNAQQLGGGYFPMSFGVGMGMRMAMGVGCSPTQFPSTSLMPLSAPGIAEARFNMVGYPGQALLMTMSPSPFVSLSPPQSIHAPAEVSQPAVAAAAHVEIPASIPLSTSRDSNPTCH